MKLDTLGNPIYQQSDILDLIYNRNLSNFDKIIVDESDEIQQFYKLISSTPQENSSLDQKEFDLINQDNWFISDEYKNMDIEGYLFYVCPKENYQRLIDELSLYKEKNLIPLLKSLKYVVDTFRKNNILWGVGRGSSVSSYVLFLLGVHKIDSVKYNLDYKEFLR